MKIRSLAFAALLLVPSPALTAENTPIKQAAAQPTVTATPDATAEWLNSIFSVANGHLTIAGKKSDAYRSARLKFAGTSEIRLHGTQIIADQAGMYPVMIGPSDNEYRVSLYTPFYAFLDESIGPDGLPAYTPHPKADLMTTRGFRKIAEMMHTHFTKIAGALPEHHRVLDEILYPSEHYVWVVGKEFVILTAYDGNDSDGIYLTITSETKNLDQLRKMQPTQEAIFDGWGDPLPHKEAVRN